MANHPPSPGGEDERPDPEIAADAVVIQKHEPTLRGILRVVATVVASAVALYLIYLLRTPIGWLCVATFVAVSVAAPVRRLETQMPRGAAIALVYLTLVLIPIGIGVILVPPAVTAGSDLVGNLPSYVDDVSETVQENDTLRGLNEDYDLVGKLEDAANDAAGSLDDVAATLADIGAGLVGSLFALFTIIVMSIF
ncbi:MAG TPA: AI-2E family transporter, partial [Solirubrobacterales bacterium]|nr:AI-2E family transporter [Solirubrobacterales bacterium]